MDKAKRIVDRVCVVLLAAMLLGLVGGWFDVAKAADPVPDNNPRLWVYMVAPVVKGDTVELHTRLSNGRRDVLKPCRYEDGRHCYWVGSSFGNGNGRDFIVTAGTVFYLDLGWTQRR